MGRKSFSVGSLHQTSQGVAKVTKALGKARVEVEFQDECGARVECYITNLSRGKVSNPFAKVVHGVGFRGILNTDNHPNQRVKSEAYNVWLSMMNRCYGDVAREASPTYYDCEVAEGWHDFSVFSDWYHSKTVSGARLCLDKDIIKRGNRVYCEEFCSLVPQEINNLILSNPKTRGDLPIGVYEKGGRFISYIYKEGRRQYLGSFKTQQEAFERYKKEKEMHIRNMVLVKYPKILDGRVVESLLAWEVNIDD